MAYEVMAYVVMDYIVMAYVVMGYLVMAYAVMAAGSGRCLQHAGRLEVVAVPRVREVVR